MPQRISLLKSFGENYTLDTQTSAASVSSILKNTFSIFGVTYIISGYDLTDRQFQKIDSITAPTDLLKPVHIYKNTKTYPRFHFASNTKPVSTVQDVVREWSTDRNINDIPTLVEDNSLDKKWTDPQTNQASIIFESGTELQLSTNATSEVLLIVTDTVYPGWNVYIDGKRETIHTVNLTQRAAVVPKGNHTVKFRFQPDSFEVGRKITIASHIIIFLIVFLFRGSSADTIFQNKRTFPYHPYR